MKLTSKPIVPAADMLAATWDQQGFVVYSSALKSVAIKVSKLSSDLIPLTSGPRAGLAIVFRFVNGRESGDEWLGLIDIRRRRSPPARGETR